jgi:hypothetical protein
MGATEWNEANPPGSAVEITRVDGKTFRAYTTTPAYRVGEHDFVELFGYQGLWLLSWCRPLGK